MKKDLPEIINKAFDVVKKYDLKENTGEYKDILEKDMLDFIVFLESSNITVDYNVLDFTNKLLTTGFNVFSFRDYAVMNGLKDDDYAKKVPKIIVKILSLEREETGFTASFYKDTRCIYTMFKELGYYIISLDGNISDKEINRFNNITNNIIRYILKEESVDYLSFDMLGSASVNLKDGKLVKDENESDNNLFFEKNKTDKNVYFEEAVEEESIEDILNSVNQLIGLDGVKRDINNLVNLIRIQKMRKERGLKVPNVGLHLVFTGNPGTGKTTIARSIAKIYKNLGLINKGHLIETSRSGLVAGYMGQTAAKVDEVVDSAIGGVLFIDEAYTLNSSNEGDYGKEAIDALLKRMEDDRLEFAVIVAGYENEMEKFLSSNPGLRSRFNRVIKFEDYSAQQLVKIYQKMCNDNQYRLSDEAQKTLEKFYDDMVNNKSENFANAREVRNHFEKTVSNQAGRILNIQNLGNDEIITIESEDIISN